MSLVLAKAAVELLVITIDHFRTGRGENQFLRAQSWFLVVGLGVGAILQLVYLNLSLTFAGPALICPLAFCFFNLSSIFGVFRSSSCFCIADNKDGLVFYDQFGQLRPHQIALVTIGVVILLLGVWVVSVIQPTGEGGVEVGTWAEEESINEGERDTFEPDENTTLLGAEQTAEPDGVESDLLGFAHHYTQPYSESPISPL